MQAQPTQLIVKLISVPGRWDLQQSGTSNISLDVENRGVLDSFTTKRDSKTLTGVYIVKLLFDEPTNYCEKLGNAPTATTLSIVGSFTGLLASNFFPVITVPPVIGLQGPFAGASASVNILPAFPSETLPFGGMKEINRQRPIARTVGDGSRISFAGNLEAFAYQGLSLSPSSFSLASAHLDVNGTFIGSTRGTVDYKVPVPEPLTIFGSATGLGFAAFFKRKHSKKQKKS